MSDEASPIRILVADDHPIVRRVHTVFSFAKGDTTTSIIVNLKKAVVTSKALILALDG